MFLEILFKLYSNRLYLYILFTLLFNVNEGLTHICLFDDGPVSGDAYGFTYEEEGRQEP